MGDLDEHFSRLRWTRKEISRLCDHVADYTGSHPLEVYWHYDFHRTHPSRIYRLRLRETIPDDIAIHSGVILNELRAILDALACTLALRNSAADVSGTYFPTGKTKEIFESKEIQRKIKKLNEQDKAIVAALRPYAGGNDMLYALHSSDLIRKHQRLIVLSGVTANMKIGSDKGWTLDGSKFNFIKGGPEHPLNEPIAQLAHDYHIEFEQEAVVAFSEPAAIKDKPLVATLNEFSSLVESALKLFLR